MKRIGLLVPAVLLTTLVVWAWAPTLQAMKPDLDKTPTVFCNVTKQPDPALMGGWKCIFKLQLEEGSTDTNPAEYWLIKVKDQYALYFDRIARGGKKRYMGWRDWTINGKEIDSGDAVRIYTEKGEVFFCWKSEKPVKMTRIE